MRIGVMSDIHSNIVAFKAVAKKLQELQCDEYFLLGDYISDTPYARETLDYLYEFIRTHKCHILRGNREDYMISQAEIIRSGKTSGRWSRNSASGNLLFTYEQLNSDDIEFFKNLPTTFLFSREGYPEITCCHGSPVNTRELLFEGRENTIEWLRKIPTDYLLCAHTHAPCNAQSEGKYYYNSGCVGIAIEDYGYAQCLVLEDAIEEETGRCIWRATNLKVPYDYKKVIRDIYSSGLMQSAPWFINSNVHILTTGIDLTVELIELANKLSEETGVSHVWPDIEERFFEQATKQLGIPDYRYDID